MTKIIENTIKLLKITYTNIFVYMINNLSEQKKLGGLSIMCCQLPNDLNDQMDYNTFLKHIV